MSDPVRDAGYDDWLDDLAAGEGTYLACPEGHGSLPPRRVCPTCGSADLTETPLPETGEVLTYTVVHVGTPAFDDETPYATAIADFGPVRLTGVVRGVDPEDVTVGATVVPAVGSNPTTGDRMVVLQPQ
ncbi:MAG: Zn-ribbon domain-containing OB-fold protein [Haloferacaceae archaeon]